MDVYPRNRPDPVHHPDNGGSTEQSPIPGGDLLSARGRHSDVLGVKLDVVQVIPAGTVYRIFFPDRRADNLLHCRRHFL